jgi:hypothetical protein
MKTGTLGAAVVTGYLLGRFHKMKWALGIAAVAGGKRLVGKQGNVLGQATEMAKSAGLDKLTGDLRGRLVDAGKAAAVSAVSNKIDSFSEGLQSRSESLRGGGRPGRDGEDAEESPDAENEEPEDREDGEPEDREDGEPEDREDGEPEDREDGERPAGRKRPDSRRPPRGDGRSRSPRSRSEDGNREPARPARRRSSSGDERRASSSRRGGDG